MSHTSKRRLFISCSLVYHRPVLSNYLGWFKSIFLPLFYEMHYLVMQAFSREKTLLDIYHLFGELRKQNLSFPSLPI